MGSTSIGARMDHGRGQGFDLLRLGLALGVICYHAFGVAAYAETLGPWQIVAESIVPAFFVLSGFLVTGSAMRSSVPQFAIKRALRIIPALAVMVVVSVAVLGPLLTSLDSMTYFSSPETAHYLLNIVGLSQMSLPGVFMGSHPEGAVLSTLHADSTFNVSLWTIGWEMTCYLMVALLLAARLVARPGVVLSLFVGIMAFRLGLYIGHPDVLHLQTAALGPIVFPGLEMHNLEVDLTLQPWSFNWFSNRLALHVTSWEFRVIPFFLAGMLCYLWRHELRRNASLAAASAGAVVLVSFAFPAQESTPLTTVLTAAPIAYLVAYCGTASIARPRWLKGDYSYGVYLWAFPIQQMIHLHGLDRGSPWANMALAIPLTLLVGCASWHLVEWPLLARRRYRPHPQPTVSG